MHQLVRLGRTGAVIAALALLVRCGGSDLLLPSESSPTTITKLNGDEQRGAVGAPLPDSFKIF